MDLPVALKVLLYAAVACLSYLYFILLFAIPFSVHNRGLFSSSTPQICPFPSGEMRPHVKSRAKDRSTYPSSLQLIRVAVRRDHC